jgi:carotenoid cleavage dioxygenase
LWNFGYLSAANLFVLWHIDAKGKLVKVGKVNADPMTMVHDFIVTKNHLVLLLPPFNFDASGTGTFLESHNWQPDEPTRVLVVDKNDFDNHYWLELPLNGCSISVMAGKTTKALFGSMLRAQTTPW